MSDTTQKCQFVACFAPRTPTEKNRYTVSMNMLHYPYLVTPAEFYETEPFFYVGTMEFDHCKIHITWQRSAKNDLTPTVRGKVKEVVTQATVNRAWSAYALIDFQVQAHRRAQELEAYRREQEAQQDA